MASAHDTRIDMMLLLTQRIAASVRRGDSEWGDVTHADWMRKRLCELRFECLQYYYQGTS